GDGRRVVVYKMGRFSRNAGDGYGMINQLKKLSIEPQAIEQSNYEDYQQYIDGGFAVLRNLPKAFGGTDLRQKQHLSGSIFHEKLVFEEKNYRTIEPNALLELIALSS